MLLDLLVGTVIVYSFLKCKPLMDKMFALKRGDNIEQYSQQILLQIRNEQNSVVVFPYSLNTGLYNKTDRLLLVVCMYDYTKDGRVPLLAISVYAACRCLTCHGVLN